METSYLLQKMEEYEGIVILATNLRDNMDAAFYAAENGEAIAMEHIQRGAKREFEKIGKLWSELNLQSSGSRKH